MLVFCYFPAIFDGCERILIAKEAADMKRTGTLFVLFCFCAVMLCGCSRTQAKPVYRAVTHVDIVTKYENQLIRRHYSTPEKMRPVLLYLRLLKPYGKPVQVEETEDVYLISISLSDGQRHYYRQASHKYLSKENGPWKSIDPAQAAQLYSILRELPSD